jgi:hypothetical protein
VDSELLGMGTRNRLCNGDELILETLAWNILVVKFM